MHSDRDIVLPIRSVRLPVRRVVLLHKRRHMTSNFFFYRSVGTSFKFFSITPLQNSKGTLLPER